MIRSFCCFLTLSLAMSMYLGISHAEEVSLSRFGLEPNKESLKPYLQSLLPGSPELAKIDQAFSALGSDTYDERVGAFTDLRDRPFVPPPKVVHATRDPDPEVRLWAERLLVETGRRNMMVLLRALGTISDPEAPILGLTDELLDLNAQLPDPSFIYQARQALLSTARANDLERILADFELRPAVHHLKLLDQLLGKQCRPYLEPVFAAVADEVGLAPGVNLRIAPNANRSDMGIEAARLLLKHGDRRPLALLASMIDGEGNLRREAAELLGKASGKSFPDAAGWQSWVEQNGATAQLAPVAAPIPTFERFVGRWDNIDPDTRSWTRVMISRLPSGQLSVEFFASVGRKEQSLGVARAQVVDPTTLSMGRFLNFKVTDYTLTLQPNGTLQARSETLYIDNSGRAQRVRLDTLGKGLEKEWLVSP